MPALLVPSLLLGTKLKLNFPLRFSSDTEDWITNIQCLEVRLSKVIGQGGDNIVNGLPLVGIGKARAQ